MSQLQEWENKIICGDCLELMKQLPDRCVDLVILDPPFDVQGWTSSHHGYQFAAGINWSSWANLWIKQAHRILKESGTVFAVANYQGYHYLVYGLAQVGFFHHADYQVAYKGSRKRPSLNKFHVVTESWFYGTKKDSGLFKSSGIKPLTGNQTHLSYWLDPDGTVRRWEKSKDLISYFISLTTNENDLILDPFMGSGTTAVAAKQLGRRFIGFEINQKYVDIANERLKQEVFDL